jgi:RNA polymerase sigma-70 factor (ECF subfamily)
MYAQTTTHATLLARMAKGDDAAAWDEFCRRYGDLIRSFARRHGLQAADSEDVLQEVLLGLTRSLPNFEYDPERARFRTYLKTIILRAIYRRFRQKEGEAAIQDIEATVSAAAEDPAVEEMWEQDWRQYHLRLAMCTIEAEFNAVDRAAFEQYVGAGRGAQETADLLEISIDRVYQAKSRIIRRLSELIEQQVLEEG